jgi:hypothetical protein
VHPRGAVSLDEAQEAIELWEFYSHKQLDEGQRLAVELMLAEDAAGRWAARTTGRAMPRQSGKGDEIEVVEAWGLLQRGEAIVHTAHEIPTAMSAHQRLVGLFESHRDLRSKVFRAYHGSHYRAIEMTGGGVIVYRTRTAGGGRGLDDISRLVVDEAQHAQPEQLASSTPILAANPNPQLNFLGTGAISGRSDWWWTLRKRAIDGDGDGFGWLEHSAERVEVNRDGRIVQLPVDARDPEAWRRANPALWSGRIEREFLAEQLKVLGPDLFAREHLCVWDPYHDGESSLVELRDWHDLADERSSVKGPPSYGLAGSNDGKWFAIGSAGRRPDGHLHVDVVERRRGSDWVVDRVADIYSRRRQPFQLDPSGTEGGFVRQLRERGVDVVEVDTRDYQQGCAEFLSAVNDQRLRHLGQESLTNAVGSALRRDVGKEGGWVWAWPAGVDGSACKAATLALSGVMAPVKAAIW